MNAHDQLSAMKRESDRKITAGFAKSSDDMVAATKEFVSDMHQLLSPERVAAIWAGEPDPWEEGQ